jgi:hypothetical protein
VKRFTLVLWTAAIAASISGCATDPALAVHYDPIQSHQKNDMNLSCPELSANIDSTTAAIATLDRQIADQQSSSSGFSLMSAVASVSGIYAQTVPAAQLASAEGTLANTGAAIEANGAFNTQQIRAMYQDRHDVLTQLYYQNNCRQ